MGFRFAIRASLAALALLGIAALPQAAQAQSLTTIYAGGNGLGAGGAVFFDLTAASSLTITAMDVNADSTVGTNFSLDIFTRSSTFSGSETVATGWTLVSSGTGVSAGAGAPSAVDLTDFVLGSGLTGIAVRYNNTGMDYTDGNGSNQVYSNADLTLTAGSSSSTPFAGGGINTPRVWNGTIYYSGGASSAPEPGTLALLVLGVTGGIVSRRRK